MESTDGNVKLSFMDPADMVIRGHFFIVWLGMQVVLLEGEVQFVKGRVSM